MINSCSSRLGSPVPHKKAVIRNVHVISIASQSSKLSLLQQCIENFIAMAIPRQLLTRRSIQHEQLRLVKWRMACSTQESCNQKCSRDFFCIAIVETIFTPAMH